MRRFRNFRRIVREEDGAVTVEWVVLTAIACSLALAVGKLIGTSTYTASSKIADYLESVEIQDDF